MTFKVTVPELGESVTEATIASWIKKKGDYVDVDENIVELETEKVTMEVPSPKAGLIIEILANENEDVNIGAELCVIDESAAKPASNSNDAKSSSGNENVSNNAVANASNSDSKNIAVAPSAQSVLNSAKIDVKNVNPTGPLGNITREDANQAVQNKEINVSMPKDVVAEDSTFRRHDNRGERVVPMSKLRRVIASRLKEAQNTAAMLTTFNEVDMTNIMEMRSKYKDLFEKKHGIKLGFMSFFVKACVYALKEYEAINAEINGNDIIYKNYNDIGIAVGSPSGLVVPILRNAEELDLMDIEKEIAKLGNKAREGTLTMKEMTGGTFTITNGGVFGSMLSTPILNRPQSGILGMHNIQARPVVMDGEIVIRNIMYLAFSYDHRIVDGREAVSFLVRVKQLIENPERLMLSV